MEDTRSHPQKKVLDESFEAFTAVVSQVEVFWIVTPCNCCGRIPTLKRSTLSLSSG